MAETIRVALGQMASIGTLYDAAKDTVINDSILKEVPLDAISTTELWKVETFITSDGGLKEKLQALGIKGETAASILAGWTIPRGAGSYLRAELGKAPSLQGAYHQRVTAVQQRLRLGANGVGQRLDMAPLNIHRQCTHIVVGITWGLHSIATVRHYLNDPTVSKDVAAAFHADLQQMQHIIDTKATSAHAQNAASGLAGVLKLEHEFTLFSDAVGSEEGLYAQNLLEVTKFIRLVPDHINRHGDGRGWQMSFILMPLVMLHHFVPFSLTSPEVFPISPDNVAKVIELFDSFALCEEKLRSYRFFLARHSWYISQNHLHAVDTAINQLLQSKKTATSHLREALAQIRQGKTSDSSALVEFCNLFTATNYSPQQISTIAGQENSRIRFICEAVAGGAVYVGHNGLSLEDILKREGDGDSYVLLFKRSDIGNSEAWDENCSLLREILANADPSRIVFVVDCDATRTCQQLDGPRIRHLRGGQEITPDLLSYRQ